MALQKARIGPAPHIAVDWRGSGPLLVMLHGIGGARTNWRGQLEVFGSRYTAAAWDARGYGDSDDYEGPLRFEDLCADLDRVLDSFGAEKAHILGLSMGSRVALDYYKRRPQRVATLILCSARTAQGETEADIEQFLGLRRRPLIDEGKSTADIAPTVAETLLGPYASGPARLAVTASLAALRKDSYLKALETVTRYRGFAEASTIQVPTLVMAGEHDRSVPPAHAMAMAQSIPGAQLRVIPRAGHLTNIEEPDIFNAAVLAFLDRHRDIASTPAKNTATFALHVQ